MFLSVIIPTFNRLTFLPRTLESIWAQTYTDFEIIVVDDGSTDGTPEYLRSLGSRVRALSQVNRGPGAARNLGTSVAQGSYVAFLDSDDVWFPWSLETYASLIRQHRSPAFLAGRPFRFDRDALLVGASQLPLRSEWFSDYLTSGDEWRWWGVSSFVIRTDALRASGGFAEANMNGEDGDLAMKLGDAPGFVQVVSPFTFGYREHADNITADLSKSVAGVWYKALAERAGKYPGGSVRRAERWRILTRHIRPVSLACLREGRIADGCRLYRVTFGWHLELRRWKYLLAFPAAACAAVIRLPQTN